MAATIAAMIASRADLKVRERDRFLSHAGKAPRELLAQRLAGRRVRLRRLNRDPADNNIWCIREALATR
jgi:hypothetical protein